MVGISSVIVRKGKSRARLFRRAVLLTGQDIVCGWDGGLMHDESCLAFTTQTVVSRDVFFGISRRDVACFSEISDTDVHDDILTCDVQGSGRSVVYKSF